MTRKEQADNQKKKIMLVALKLFIRKGRVATSIQEIAKNADMSVGLLYNYFESKDKLFEELIKIGTNAPNMIMKIERSSPINFFEMAAQKILTMIEDEYASSMFVLMSQALFDESLPENIKKLLSTQDNITASIEIIKQGQSYGEIREGESQALSMAFWCALQGIAEQKARTPSISLPSYNWIVDIIRRKA